MTLPAERGVVHALPDVLAWSPAPRLLGEVHQRYRDRVAEALACQCGVISSADPALGEQLVTLIQNSAPTSLLRAVLAPEATYRLLWSGAFEPAEVGTFLCRSLRAEAARAGGGVDATDDLWTALGDAVVLSGGKVVHGPVVAGLVPLDVGSPYATTIELSSGRRAGTARPPLVDPGLSSVLRLLEEVAAGLEAASPSARDFVMRCTKVLIVQDDPDSVLASGSVGRYIGRSLVSSSDWRQVDHVGLADAVVHEAMHALLFMEELEEPWVLDESLWERRTVSPWSGVSVRIDAFLHACFVWYGLVHFWRRALDAAAFAEETALGRLDRARKGFLGAPLLQQVAPADLELVAPHVRETIVELQERVTRQRL